MPGSEGSGIVVAVTGGLAAIHGIAVAAIVFAVGTFVSLNAFSNARTAFEIAMNTTLALSVAIGNYACVGELFSLATRSDRSAEGGLRELAP
jgi:hypothetical protein